MLVTPDGKPLASDAAVEAMKKRALENFEAMKAVLDERKIPPNELMDVVVNLFSLWCSACPATLYEQQVGLFVQAMTQTFQSYAPMKAGELKIRQQLATSNPGAANTQ